MQSVLSTAGAPISFPCRASPLGFTPDVAERFLVSVDSDSVIVVAKQDNAAF
jgi:hypothetical protein